MAGRHMPNATVQYRALRRAKTDRDEPIGLGRFAASGDGDVNGDPIGNGNRAA